MASITIEFSDIAETQATLGIAGSHSVVADRPAGRAGGEGLGFNGGQLLALAIGGCYCNDLRYVAHDMGIELIDVHVAVTLDLDGDPLIVTGASLTASCATSDGTDPNVVIERASAISTVANSVMRGFPVRVNQLDRTP